MEENCPPAQTEQAEEPAVRVGARAVSATGGGGGGDAKRREQPEGPGLQRTSRFQEDTACRTRLREEPGCVKVRERMHGQRAAARQKRGVLGRGRGIPVNSAHSEAPSFMHAQLANATGLNRRACELQFVQSPVMTQPGQAPASASLAGCGGNTHRSTIPEGIGSTRRRLQKMPSRS